MANEVDIILRLQAESNIDKVIAQATAELNRLFGLAGSASAQGGAGSSLALRGIAEQYEQVARVTQTRIDEALSGSAKGAASRRLNEIIRGQTLPSEAQNKQQEQAIASLRSGFLSAGISPRSILDQDQRRRDLSPAAGAENLNNLREMEARGAASAIANYKSLSAITQAKLAEDQQYIQAEASISRSLNQQRAGILEANVGSTDLAQSRARTAAANNQIAAATGEELAKINENIGVMATLQQQRARAAAGVAQENADNEQLRDSQVELAAGKRQLSASVKAELAANEQNIAATVSEAESKARATIQRIGAQNPELLRRGLDGAQSPDLDLTGQEAIARAAVLEKTQANIRAASSINAQTELDVRTEVETRAAQARLRAAIQQQERAYIREGLKAGTIEGGTRFQNLQARFSPAAGRLPSEFQTLGQFVGSKVTNTIGYGIGGLITGGAIAGLVALVKSSSEFEQTLVRLQGQLQGLGKGADFTRMRAEIKSIAADTGQAQTDVANFARRMLGVFGDPDRALAETAAAMKLAAVAGLDLQTAMQSLVPIAKNFGVSIEDVGNLAVAVSEKYGLAEDSVVDFLGKTAATAKEAGLDMGELATIGANMANSLGKDLGASADVFNQIPQFIQANQEKIYAILQSRPQTQGIVSTLTEQIGAGDTGKAFETLIANYDKLDKTQQDQLLRQLATRRNIEEVTAVMGQASKITKELADGQLSLGNNSGKLNSRFEDVRDTLSNMGDRIKQTFQNMGESLISSGIGDILISIGNAAGVVVGAIGLLAEAFKALNDATKFGGVFESGLLATLVGYVAIAALATKAIGALGFAKKANAVATQEQVVAETELDGTIVRTTVVTKAETVAVEENTAAKAVNGELGATRFGNVAGEAEQAAGAASRGGFFSRLGGRVTGSGLFQRATSGASTSLFTNATADAAAAEAGTATGLSAVPVAGITIAGLLAVKNARDQQSENLQKASDDLRAKMQQVSDARLKSIAEQSNSFWDNVESFIFRVDMPNKLAQETITARATEPGSKTLQGLVDTGSVKDFANRVNDRNLQALNDYFNTQEGQGAAAELGVDVQALDLNNQADLEQYAKTGFQGRYTLTKEKLAEILPNLKGHEKDEGYKTVFEVLQKAFTEQGDLADIQAKVKDAIGRNDTQSAVDAAGGLANFAAIEPTYAEGKLKYQSGEFTSSQYITAINHSVDLLRQTIPKNANLSDPQIQQTLQTIAEREKEARDLVDQNVKTRVDTIAKLAELGSNTPAALTLQATLTTLPQLSHQAQIAAIPDLLQKANAAVQETINNIGDPLERAQAALNTPIKLPPELRSLIVQQQLEVSPDVANQLQNAATIVGGDKNALMKQFADTAVATNQSVREVMLKWVDDQIANTQKAIDAVQGRGASDLYKTLGDLRNLRGQLDASTADIQTPEEAFASDPGNVKARNEIEARYNRAKAQVGLRQAQLARNPIGAAQASLDEAWLEYAEAQELVAKGGDKSLIPQALAKIESAKQEVQSRADELELTKAHWAEVMANGDPVAVAAAQIGEAQIELAHAIRDGDQNGIEQARQKLQELQFQQQDNQVAILKARQNVGAALVERDPLKVAQNALEQAQTDFANAKTEADRWNAFAAGIKAQHQIEDALSAIFESRSNLAIALANAAENPVEAARLAMAEAKRKLDEAIAQGRGEAEINSLRGAYDTSTATWVKQQRDERLSIIDFQLQMNQITTAQAVAMMQAELATLDQNTESYRQLALRIRSLMQQSEQDAQFNLPSNLALPTLYEARRVNQSNQAGIGYQDNRQVAVAITINGANDAAAVANQVMAAFNSAAGGGALYAPQTVGVNP